jgi:hypothetical protein
MSQPRTYSSHAQRQAAYRARQQQARRQEQHQHGLPPLPLQPTVPGTARWNAALQNVHLLLEQICQEMQDYYDERTQRWKEGERGTAFRLRLKWLKDYLWDLDNVPD